MANENWNESECQSQNKRIAAWLNSGKSITQFDALNMFGCMRLASRINDLRNRGMNIVTEKFVTPTTGKVVASYRLESN